MSSLTRTIAAVLVALPISLSVLVEAQPSESAPQETSNSDYAAMHSKGVALLKTRKPQEAISQYFDPIIAAYSEKYKDSEEEVYCAQSKTEELFYLLKAANDKKDAIIVPAIWAEALYHKGYALIELRKYAEARAVIEQAAELSPQNAQYLSELGHIYSLEKNWTKAIETYELSAEAAGVSPENLEVADRTRAWRGIGYAYVELGRLDEAQAIYEKCLTIDPNDGAATRELDYVKSIRAKLAAR